MSFFSTSLREVFLLPSVLRAGSWLFPASPCRPLLFFLIANAAPSFASFFGTSRRFSQPLHDQLLHDKRRWIHFPPKASTFLQQLASLLSTFHFYPNNKVAGYARSKQNLGLACCGNKEWAASWLGRRALVPGLTAGEQRTRTSLPGQSYVIFRP